MMGKRLLVLYLLLSLSAGALRAAVPENGAEGAVVIRAGRLVDVRTGKVLTHTSVLVRKGRIVAVGEDVRVPADAEVIDLGPATLLPGLIDLHTHLTFNHRFFGYRGLGVSVPRQTLYGAVNARRVLQAGFTTVRNLGAAGYADVALRDAINDGDIAGPRMLVSGPALGITGGHCDNNLLPAEFNHRAAGVADGPWAVRAKVREVVKYGADVIKFCATGGVLSKGDEPGTTQYTLEEMKAIVEEAHKLGRRVAAHAHGTEGIQMAVRAGVDSIEHGTLIDQEGIALMRQHGTYLVPTVYAGDYIVEQGAEAGIPDYGLRKMRGLIEGRDPAFRAAFPAGVKVAFGTDIGVFRHDLGGREFARMVGLGLTRLEAIRSATVVAAEALGLESEIGTIEAGKRADIIAVAGDPLEDIRTLEQVKFVMKGGRVWKNDF
ncbi:MAG: amidohydrolase family protein [Terriglobia bacterium]